MFDANVPDLHTSQKESNLPISTHLDKTFIALRNDKVSRQSEQTQSYNPFNLISVLRTHTDFITILDPLQHRLGMDYSTSSLASLPALETNMERQLAPEILLTIFEVIQDQPTLRHLRLVSKQFEELVTPIWCREVVLTPDIVAEYSLREGWADHSILQVQRTIHTKQVIIKKELNWLLVNRLLSTLKNLQSLL